MTKSEEAVRYMLSVWDEVRGNWRETPDHVEQMFLEAEKELNENPKSNKDELKKSHCEFFRWWWNQPGQNTEQGYDDWIKSKENEKK